MVSGQHLMGSGCEVLTRIIHDSPVSSMLLIIDSLVCDVDTPILSLSKADRHLRASCHTTPRR